MDPACRFLYVSATTFALKQISGDDVEGTEVFEMQLMQLGGKSVRKCKGVGGKESEKTKPLNQCRPGD